ncbi:hypothetical protein AEGHOMDF_3286 [Methylobacterium soli]|nr:hypothetical protein AEGHOMDF_3286 [Methylobacterium soli]
MIAPLATDRPRLRAAVRRSPEPVRSSRVGILASVLALLLLVLAGLPDDRFADLMPRRAEPGITNRAVAKSAPVILLGGRHAALTTSVEADDPPADDRRLVPDPPRFHRLPVLSGFPPEAGMVLSFAGVRLLERPPKSVG